MAKKEEIDFTQETWLSIKEVADMIGVSRQTIYNWLENKEMKAFKTKGVVRIAKSEVNRFVNERIS